MVKKVLGAALCALCISTLGLAQASVNESLETVTLYVDAVNGSDSNPGTQALPLQTIGAAAAIAEANNRSGVGTKVIINPGTYRENVTLAAGSNETTLPITLEAATNGTVIVSGAEVWTGWTASTSNPNIFTRPLSSQFATCPADTTGPFEQNIVLKQEMVFVNGTPLTQVLSQTQLLPGTFFVDETNGLISIYPPAGTNVSTATIEVAITPNLLSILNKSDVVIRGLTFQYADSCRTNDAVDVQGGSTNILFDTDNFLWNNGEGLKIDNPTNHVTVQNSAAMHNGQSGFGTFEAKSILWQNDQTGYTNWRGAQGAYYSWNTAGNLFFSEHSQTIQSMTSNFNQTFGIHWDTDNINISADSVTASNNLLAGLFVEKNQGPAAISSGLFCSNNIINEEDGGGIALRDSSSITLTEDTLYNNSLGQIVVGGQPGGIPISDWETGQGLTVINGSLSATSNTIEGLQNEQLFMDSYLGGSEWTNFLATLTSNSNTWWDASNTSPFTVPEPQTGTTLNFVGWQSVTHPQETNSVFAQPAANLSTECQLTPDAPDFWFTVDNDSQTINAALQAPFTATVVPLGFTGTASLSFDGLQSIPGATAAWSATSINTSGSSTFTITTGSTTPPGTYPVTLLANSGNLTRTVTVSLVVPATDFSISPTPASATVKQGQSASYTLSLSPANGFNQSVALSCAVTPPGPNCSITPQTVPVSGSSVAIAVATVTTTAPSMSPPAPELRLAPPFSLAPLNLPELLMMVVVALAAGLIASRRRPAWFVCGIALFVMFLWIACGGGSGTSSGNTPSNATPSASLSPASLTFASQAVGTSSVAQTVTLTNTGGATLNLSGISATGDFTQTNTCGNSLAAAANCQFNVTFKPTSAGARNGALSISDNASGSPQSVTLAGTGTSSPTGTGTYTITITGTSGSLTHNTVVTLTVD